MAQSGRANDRATQKIADSATRRGAATPDEWIDEAIREYAEDLGVDPGDLDERERLEAIQERMERAARSGAAARRADADEGAAANRRGSARRGYEPSESPRRSRVDYEDEPRPAARPPQIREADPIDDAADRIERGRRRFRTDGERLEAAIESLSRRAERSEARTARALEALLSSTALAGRGGPTPAPTGGEDSVGARLNALARRASAPPAPARATVPPDEDEETFRLVSERLARRRKPQAEPAPAPAPQESKASDSSVLADLQQQMSLLVAKVDSLAGAPKEAEAEPQKDPNVARMERELAPLAERIDRAARPEARESGKLAEELHRRLEELGRRIEANARPQTADPRPMEELARRIEAIRAAVERQSARPETAALLAGLADLNDKIDRASANGAQSAAAMTALQGLVARLEDAMRRPTPAPIDPRPLEDLARRIDGVRGHLERQDTLTPKVEQIHAALGELRQRVERPAPPAVDAERLEAALRQISADVHALAAAGAPDMRPVEDLARRVEALRSLAESHGALAPKVERIQSALDDLRRKFDPPPASANEVQRLEAALRQLSGDVHALAAAGAPDMRPVEELARRIEAMRKAIESHAELSPQVERLERSLAGIAARLDRPVEHPGMVAVDASLRQLAAKFEEAVSRPATVALDTKPIEDLARRIESVRASLEAPAALSPQVERLETALGAMSEKLDRVQPMLDAQGVNSTLAEMNARLEQAFRRPAEVALNAEPLQALSAEFAAVRETVERQAGQFDFDRLKDAVREAVSAFDRPTIGPDEFRAIVSAIQALAAKIDVGAHAMQADVLERIADRLDQAGLDEADASALSRAVRDLSAKLDRPSDDLALVAQAISDLAAKLDGAGAAQAGHHPNIAARLDALDARLAGVRPPDENFAQLESALTDLGDKLGDFTAAADTRAVEQELRLLQEKIDDLVDARLSDAFAEQTARAVARALGERGQGGDSSAVLGSLQDLHDRLDTVTASQPSTTALERTMAELAEELEALRGAREAVGRGAATLSEMRAEQVQLDRRMDARFSSVQEILEKLVDRLNPGAPAAVSPAPPPARAALLDIPDRSGDDARAAPAPSPEIGAFAAPPRPREGAESPKSAAINAHIAAARRAANAAVEAERREEANKTSAAAENASGGWAQRANAMFQQHRMPVLLSAAGAMTLLTGVAVLEMRGHAPVKKSELTTPATPLAEAPAPKAAAVDLGPTGAIDAPKVIEAPKVIGAPLPPPDAAPAPKATPPSSLLAALPSAVGPELSAAAARGDVGAEVEIAQRYFEGRSVPRDSKAAAAWMQQAADAGNAFAQYRLGAMFEKGVGETRDIARARGLYEKAANAGNARAMHNLAVVFAQDGGAGKPDYAGALTWFRKAAEYGVRDSQFNLGVLYGRGLGAPQDLAQSWMWFSVAARQGDADAARKRDEVANRMDGRMMAAAQKLLDQFKPKTPDPAVNDPPRPPAAAAAKAPAESKAAGVKG